MKYLINRNGWYMYNRRIPKIIMPYDQRGRIRIALNTQCEIEAVKRLLAINDNVEKHWQELIQSDKALSNNKLDTLKSIAKANGFNYAPTHQLLNLPLHELLSRILAVEPIKQDKTKVEALLGREEESSILLSQALERYWDYTKPLLINKNLDQQRKWQNPRKKAVNNFIKHIGDKNIREITNLDMVAFRDFWLERMRKEDIKPDTVNKDFTHLKGVLDTVNTHEQLGLDIEKIFKKIHIKETHYGVRAAYTTAFIQQEIIAKLDRSNLSDQARHILKACIATGARPIELVNLIGADINLECEIPHIHIRPRPGYSLKTNESQRKIPLVGQALRSFQLYPKGFDQYRGNSDRISRELNGFLSQNNLRPTQKHSLYSFRHSFQDRLNALELQDRIQCQLMGHKFHRPKYGQGATLKHLQDIMQRLDILNCPN